MPRNPLCYLLLLMALAGAQERPNILLIMADDLGFSDLGCYGGEIETPNLDRLAHEGMRFTSFYNASRCCPTRASLMTGLYPHQAGVGRMTKGAGGGEGSAPGYKGEIGNDAVTIAEVLKSTGYQTGMVGKWHLSPTVSHPEDHMAWLNNQIDKSRQPSDPSTYPTARGFDRYYGNIWGVVDFFDPFSLVEGTEPVQEVPEDYYITDALNAKAVEYLEDFAKTDEPFFLYLAHCAPHWPLHARPEEIAKYKDTYKVGWQAIREARYQRQVDMGLMSSETAKLSERMGDESWEESENQEWEAMHMAAHAAMIDRMDQGLGAVIAKLEELGQLDNTLIFFLSDNGASPERPNRPGFDRTGETRDGEPVLYSKQMLEKGVFPGSQTTYSGIGRDWANVANTPFRFWKKEEYQGGVTTPFIVRWPKGIRQEPGSIIREAGHVVDIMATCLDVAGAEYPTEMGGETIQPMEGVSLAPVFASGDREGHDAIYFEHFGARGIRQEDWKLVSLKDKPWELYDLGKDFTETTNLAEKHPERVKELAGAWHKWAERARVFPTPEQFQQAAKPAAEKKNAGKGLQLKPKQGDSLNGPSAPSIANRTVKVSAKIDTPKDGAVVTHGGFVLGYALFVRDGHAGFMVRHSREEFLELTSPNSLPATGPITLQGELREDGSVVLSVDGKTVASRKVNGLFRGNPGDGLAVGDDPTSNVANYGPNDVFGGKISNVVIDLGAEVAPKPMDPIGTMRTRWADQVGEVPLPEYPRPQLVRKDNWQNLNGRWQYAIRPKEDTQPSDWDGEILVPFAVESQLSGVQKSVGENQRLWYQRTLSAAKPKDGRLLLHFGAVDWDATVYVNGKEAGSHKGGYDPFTLDITDHLLEGDQQDLVVSVWDPTDTEAQARGKQVSDPRGIWYTAVTGIWQTVWSETVPSSYIQHIHPVSDIDSGTGSITFTVDVERAQPGQMVRVTLGNTVREGALGDPIVVPMVDAEFWTPETPELYDITLELVDSSGAVVDQVESYAAMRKIHPAEDADGHQRLYLNNEPVFHFGPLDQGWWPDGLYTAPTDEALLFDIVKTKEMGFNAIRKHVKVEPARWYYHCDKLGMLVWQDMPTGFIRSEGATQHVSADATEDWDRPDDSSKQFEAELEQMIHNFEFFPCIVMWDLHNEGWGQYDTSRLTKWLRERDPSRLVNAVSGWTDRNEGDVRDLHHYPGPGMEPVEQNPGRAVVLGEYGGLGWPVADHLWWDKRNWGYRTYESREELYSHYEELTKNLYPMIDRGLAAAIYTQTTDVEGEVNGLMTYDREVIKIEPEQLTAWHAPLYRKPGTVSWLLRDSEVQPQFWLSTHADPGEGWETRDFDASQWEMAKAPFNSGELQYLDAATKWPGYQETLWLRQEFTIEGDPPSGLSLKIYCDGEADIYVNGKLLMHVEELRVRRHYDEMNLSDKANLLQSGKNVVAVKVTKKEGPRGFDMGLYGYPRVE